jgi:hypothetical protein
MRDPIATLTGLVSRAFGFTLRPLRVIVGSIEWMREILGVLVFLGIGVLIMAAVAWYIDIILQWWRSSNGPPVIGGVTVLGLEEANAKLISVALPDMILAELRRLGEWTNEAKRQLRELDQVPAGVAPPELRPVAFSEGLKADVAIPDTIAGFEIGWLLKPVKNVLAPTNVIDLTAIFDRDGSKATVVGHAKGKNGYAFSIKEGSGRPDDVAQAVAASIIQLQQRQGEIAVQTLPVTDYLSVVDALVIYAKYERIIRSWNEEQGSPSFQEDYNKQLEIIASIAERYKDWGELQRLASKIAERAGDLGKARSFTSNELRSTAHDDSQYPLIVTRLDYLKTPNNPQARAAVGELPDAKSLEAIRNLLTAAPKDVKEAIEDVKGAIEKDVPKSREVHIAVIGPLPWKEAQKPGQVVLLNPKTASDDKRSDERLMSYMTGLMQTARVFAPDAVYQFANVPSQNGGFISELEIQNALGMIKSRSADVDVLLFTYGPSNSEINTTLRELASRMVVVMAAGNNGKRISTFAPLNDVGVDDVGLVVGATDIEKGAQADFSEWSRYAVGAPGVGVQVPLIASEMDKLKHVDGTSYAAAFAAGVAALLKGTILEAKLEAKPADIVKALQETSEQKFPGGPRIINVREALKWLKRLGDHS